MRQIFPAHHYITNPAPSVNRVPKLRIIAPAVLQPVNVFLVNTDTLCPTVNALTDLRRSVLSDIMKIFIFKNARNVLPCLLPPLTVKITQPMRRLAFITAQTAVTKPSVRQDMLKAGQQHTAIREKHGNPAAVNATSKTALTALQRGTLPVTDAKADIITVPGAAEAVAKHAQATRAVTALMFPANPVTTSKAV